MPLIKSRYIEKSPYLKKAIKTYIDLREGYLNNSYDEYSYIRSDLESNISAVLSAAPILIIYSLIAYMFKKRIFDFGTNVCLTNILLVFVTTPIHELFHGLGWGIFCKHGFKSIYIYLPFNLSNAYCHCAEPLNFTKYALGTIMPMLFLSILPFIISLISENSILFWFSIISAFGCGSDIKNTLIAYKHKDEIILDYPTDCGFTSYKKKG